LEKISYFAYDEKVLGLAVLSTVIKYLEKEEKRVGKELMEDKDLSIEQLSEKDQELVTDISYAIDRLEESFEHFVKMYKIYKKIKKIKEMDIDVCQELKKIEESFKEGKELL
jgi:formiminotetrahydrofolate cyclodeaminase